MERVLNRLKANLKALFLIYELLDGYLKRSQSKKVVRASKMVERILKKIQIQKELLDLEDISTEEFEMIRIISERLLIQNEVCKHLIKDKQSISDFLIFEDSQFDVYDTKGSKIKTNKKSEGLKV